MPPAWCFMQVGKNIVTSATTTKMVTLARRYCIDGLHFWTEVQVLPGSFHSGTCIMTLTCRQKLLYLKMVFKIFPLLSSLILVSCNYHVADSNPKLDSLKKNIVGFWGGPGEDSPVWKITADSIYYFDQKKSYLYKVYGDSLVLYLTGHNVALNDFNVKGDTLSFKDEVGIKISAIRFKNKKWTQ